MVKITNENIGDIRINTLLSNGSKANQSYYIVSQLIGGSSDDDYDIHAYLITINQGLNGRLSGNLNLTPDDWQFGMSAKRIIGKSSAIREWFYYPNVTIP